MSGRPPGSASLGLALPAHPVMESKVGTLGLGGVCPVQTPFTTGPCSAVLCWPEGEFSRLCCGPPFFLVFFLNTQVIMFIKSIGTFEKY